MTESSFRRLLLRFALVPIVCLCAFLALLGIQLREITLKRSQASQATAILLQSNRLMKNVIDEETGLRGYLIAKNPLFLQPYLEASNQFSEEFSALSTLMSANPALSSKVTALDESFKALHSIDSALLQKDLPNDTIVDLLNKQKQAMDTIRAELDDLMSEQNDVRESRRTQVDALFERLPALAIGGAALVAVLLILNGIFLFRKITRAFRQQLRERELQRDYLDTTLQSIGDAVIVCDSRGDITLLNPAAEKVTGWPKSVAIGQPLENVFRIINEYTRLPVESPVTKVLRAGQVVGLANHTLLIRRDGSEISIDDSGAPIRDAKDKIAGVVLVFRDISQHRLEAEALRESQARFNAMYSTSLEYIGLLTPAGVIIDCNRASLDFAHSTRDKVIGMNFADSPWFAFTPGAPDQVRQLIARAASGEPIREEISLIRPSGEIIDFDFSLAPVRNSNGDVVFLVPEGRDITELKHAESALLQSEKLAAVGRLASSIAHEINNPLESVMNLIYLARQYAVAPEAQQYLDTADQEIRRVSIIANQTLRFHKQPSNPQAVSFLDLATNVLSIYEGRLKNSGISVEKRDRAINPVVCFEGDLRQVMNNLVGNAIDAMPSGGRLLIRSREATNWLTGKRGLVLTVADTGCGMSPEILRKAFEPFFTTKGIGGTGLGLWVSQEIIDRHRGVLRVRSSQRNPGGTVFTLFLPFETSGQQPTPSFRPSNS